VGGLAISPVQAHHSAAQYDFKTPVVIQGSVKETALRIRTCGWILRSAKTAPTVTNSDPSKRCARASFPERHKYLARYPDDFCHPLKPNLMQSNTVTPVQHNVEPLTD
jgi:hypothetical protein